MDRRAETSRENGKKGGRKKGTSGLLIEKGREYLTRRIQKDLKPMVDALIEKAINGDTQAFKELFDRGWGKPQQAIDHTTGGDKIVFLPQELINKHQLSAKQ